MLDMDLFRFWCYKVIPLVYDDSLSYYEVLCKMRDYINNIIEQEKTLADELTKLGVQVNALGNLDDINSAIAELQSDVKAIEDRLGVNFENVIRDIVKYVFFGLSMDGHFVASIPKSWDFIEWDTIMDSDSDLYGHLVMRW